MGPKSTPGAVAILGLVLASCGSGAPPHRAAEQLTSQSQPLPPFGALPPQPVRSGPAPTGSPLKGLTAAESARALRIFKANPLVAKAFPRFTVLSIGAAYWAATEEIVGATISFAVTPAPPTFDALLPQVVINPGPVYIQNMTIPTTEFRGRNLGGWSADISLVQGEVFDVNPLPGSDLDATSTGSGKSSGK